MSSNELAPQRISVGLPATIPLTVSMATVAAFSKSFLPLQTFGSSAIFAGALLFATLGLLLDWPVYWRIIRAAKRGILPVALLFGFSSVNFVVYSRNSVPDTYLFGMLGLLTLFLLLGLVASLAFRVVLIFLLSMAIVYSMYCLAYLIENGSLFPNGYFGDVFALGPGWGGAASYTQLYQNVGICLALGTLALIGLTQGWPANVRFWTLIICGCLSTGLILASQARGALVGLVIAVIVALRFRQIRAVALFILVTATVMVFAFGPLLESAEQLPIWRRTANEIFSPKPGTRLVLVNSALRTLYRNPELLWSGRGLGMFPVDIGDKPPDWFLSSKPASLYPHNTVLEALYELGVMGAVFVVAIMIAPFLLARRLHGGIDRCRVVLGLYVFALAGEMVSGSLAYSYPFYFFYGLTIGTIAGMPTIGAGAGLSRGEFHGTARAGASP